ncbi:hypothetical protein MMC07_003103 [Pseudocyphellaria aurata]|nr:hypothetical protein [Pseudocyphellaria aurata]
MHVSIPIFVFLASLVWLVAGDTEVFYPSGGPVYLPEGSVGAAFQLTNGESRAYYLALEGSIHELAGNGDPEKGIKYNDTVRIPAAKVRAGSPIAVSATNNGNVRLYYIGPDNSLKEFCFTATGGAGTDCALNNVNVSVKLGSKYLYAAATPYSEHTRVGYECVNGTLCEAYYYSNNVWHTREL